MVEFIILTIVAYLLGAVPAAYLAGKWIRGIDIREYGSSNVGVSNLIAATSWKIGLPVIFFDLVKGILPIWAADLMGMSISQQATVGIAAIIGHNWPIFLHLNGGRGMLTTLAVLFFLPAINGYIPWELIAFFICSAIGLFVIHSIPIGTGVGIAISPLISWLTDKPLALTLGFVVIVFILIIRRLTVPRSQEAKDISTGELLLNRLFLDRDIRDKEIWMNRKPVNKAADRQPEPHPKEKYGRAGTAEANKKPS
jgi:glycerol-3-phosphate acyltransferase PlsY